MVSFEKWTVNGGAIKWAFFVASFFTSLLVYINTPLTNTDGVLYLRVAEAYLSDGFSAAQDLYKVPYYSILFAIFSQVFSVDVIWGAYIFNSLACGVIAWCVVDLGGKVGGSNVSAAIAGLLLFLHPEFNEYRGFIVRDFHFWAFTLASLCFFVRFYLTLNTAFLILTQIFLLLAGLFRPEALLFLGVPLLCLLFLKKYPTLFRKTLIFYLLASIFTLVFVGLSIVFFDISVVSLADDFSSKWHRYFLRIDKSIAAYNGHILKGYLEDFSGPALIVSFSVLLLFKLGTAITLPYAAFYGYTYKASGGFRLSGVRTIPLWSFIGGYLLVVFFHLISAKIIQGRHVILPLLLLIPMMSAYVEFWFFVKGRKLLRNFFRLTVVSLIVLYLFVDSFFSFGDKKEYLTDSVAWLSGTYSDNCRLVTNNTKIGYFSGLNVDWKASKKIKKKSWQFDGEGVYAIEYKSESMRERLNKKYLNLFVKDFRGDDRGIVVFIKNGGDSTCLARRVL